MTLAFYTNIVSPHQLPLAREIVRRIGVNNYRYIYSEPFHDERKIMGWQDANESWIVSKTDQPDNAQRILETTDVVILDHRDLDLIERRCQKGLRTFYASERWFKPFALNLPLPFFTFTSHLHLSLPGWLRLFVPSYRSMARRFAALTRQYENFRLLPYGVHARDDFKRIGVPENKMDIWGYFVAPSTSPQPQPLTSIPRRVLRVLWVGRMLDWKRVDTIIDSIRNLVKQFGNQSVTLTLVGNGPEHKRLVYLAKGFPIVFKDSLPIDQIRQIMREHDLYVLSSDGDEGWGAALNEAMEEGMLVVGTDEAGSSATILPPSHRFPAGNSEALTKLILKAREGKLERIAINDWSASNAADRLIQIVNKI